ncbi:5-oxoprolinase subunit B family protein [Novosphingopyxis iocasae]|uniref:5-oxoprolinase subunit B family protein n=1 Tax=Novosphingopyxis iocasae TaxID=2762729 RepID=UPI0016514E39|nr:carboxyltransferase domain-containing protein [Novosphingopyxis iocasae]
MSSIFTADDWLSAPIPDRSRRHAATEHLLRADDWEEVVPGLDSLSVRFDPERTDPATARALFSRQLDRSDAHAAAAAREQVIAVCYDAQFAPDAGMVADRLGIALDDLPRWHAAQEWTVDIIGFQPGFAYCRAECDIPGIDRLNEPRQSVPAGSIGLLGGLCGLYPFEGPGGWPLIGRTPLALFDASRDQPALLSAGTSVRFEAIDRAQFDEMASR